MLDLSLVTTSLFDLLEADGDLQLLGVTVKDSGRVNYDPAICPWIGVYPGDTSASPRSMTMSSWKETGYLQVVLQAASLADEGKAASTLLESLVKKTVTVITNNLSLGTSGLRVLDFSRAYSYVQFDSDGSGDLFMPQVVLRVNFEAVTT